MIIRFGKAVRQSLSNKSSTPGPGIYETKSFTSEGPSFSFRPKLVLNSKNFVPGPGKYSPSSSLVKEKSPSWPQAKDEKGKNINAKKSSPGPGTYSNVSTLSGPKWGFGNEIRGKMLMSKVPGPGSYDIRSSIGMPPNYITLANK